MNKGVIAIIIVAVVALGGYFFFRDAYQPAPRIEEQVFQPSAVQPPIAKETIITYTNSGYLPNAVTVKKGEIITFKNNSSRLTWPASAFHPTHRDYPTAGGCLGSTFDACKGIQPGNGWSFKFDIAGVWKYHNHLSPGDTGTIVVE